MGEEIDVWAYTNCDEAELFLNGKSLGRRKALKHEHIEWLVDYEAGRLEAVGYIDGKVCATDLRETAGTPTALKLKLENKFDGVNDIAVITCYTVDSEGRFVPNAAPLVSFHTNKIGRVISTGSDICDHTPLGSPIRKMREGLISVTVGVNLAQGAPVADSGTIEIYAHAEGLKSAKLKLEF